MTQEDKELQLKDLCARLPYETWVQYEGKEWLVTGYGHGRVSLLPSVFSSVGGPCPLVEEVRPYLRPMSSMTEEENEELKYVIELGLQALEGEEGHNIVSAAPAAFEVDFYNKHHLDYRGLIEKGLALEATEGMYEK